MKKIIFDMDGVITTEQNYWNAAALTIWEHFFNEKDVKRMSECLVQIRNRVFFGDKTITLCKNIGVNSNWDLTYVVYSMTKILQSDDFGEVYRKIKQLNMDIMQLYSYLNQQGFRRGGELYNSLVDTFQQWYLGDSHYKKTYKKEPKLSGKKGLIFSEKPLHDLKKLKSILNNLKNKDYILGAATGRPKTEIIEPLKRWDLLKYFDIASCYNF